MDYVIFGTDRRFFYLAKLLKKDNETVYIANSLAEIRAYCEKPYVFVTALNLDKIKQKELLCSVAKKSVLWSGALYEENKELVEEKKLVYHDITSNELFCLKNALPTAEGCVERIISLTPYNLSGTSVLVIGFGRVGSSVARLLRRMGANVAVLVRPGKSMDAALKSNFSVLNIYELDGKKDFRILINTVAKKDVVNEKLLDFCLGLDTVIDLASGNNLNRNILTKRKITFEDAKGLPGRFCPESSAKYIYDLIKGEVQ